MLSLLLTVLGTFFCAEYLLNERKRIPYESGYGFDWPLVDCNVFDVMIIRYICSHIPQIIYTHTLNK